MASLAGAAVVAAAVAGSSAGLIFLVRRPAIIAWALVPYVLSILSVCVVLAVSLVALVWNREARGDVALTLLSTWIGLTALEIALVVGGYKLFLPSGFDTRGKLEVLMALRARGIPAYPSVHTNLLLADPLSIDGAAVLPLSGIRNVTTVFCNEWGKYYLYESDEYGFANPPGQYLPSPAVVLVGDSFTHGFCMPDGRSFAEVLRPQFDGGLLNLGMNGNGPLTELATLREYVLPLKPHRVVWVYYEGNDIEDLSVELAAPVLLRYLEDPQFTQHLMTSQTEVDTALRRYVERKIDEELSRRSHRFGTGALSEVADGLPLVLKLWHVRAMLGLVDLDDHWPLHRYDPSVSPRRVEAAFGKILREARDRTRAWGGELYFVYLPAVQRFSRGWEHPWREKVLHAVQSLGVPIIDLVPAFLATGDPVGLFPARRFGHYTAEGNKLVADAISRRIAPARGDPTGRARRASGPLSKGESTGVRTTDIGRSEASLSFRGML